MAYCPVLYQGQLMKKGKVNKSWKNRWCMLTGLNHEVSLEYYDSKIDGHCKGSVLISQIYAIEVIACSDYDLSTLNQIPSTCAITDKIKSNHKYSFILATKDRRFHFAAFDPKNFFKWLSIFSEFVYGGIIKQGWLQKRGCKNKGWKKRWFVLNQYRQIKYYTDSDRVDYAGTIILDQVKSIEMGQTIQGKDQKCIFHLTTDKRIWILCSMQSDERVFAKQYIYH